MKSGYARYLAKNQNLDLQLAALKEAARVCLSGLSVPMHTKPD